MRMTKLMWIGVFSAMTVLGCSTTHEIFGARGVAPGAEGEVVTSKDDYGNTEMKLKLKHLAPPDRINTGANAYVVWIQGVGQPQFQNVGGLNVNRDLTAEYSTRVPYENFRLIVTPEPSATVSSPSGVPVFDQYIKR